MARPQAATIQETETGSRYSVKHLAPGYAFESIPEGVVEVDDVLSGMYTNEAREHIPAGAATLVKNGRVRDNWCGSRGGLVQLLAKPDSNPVMKIVLFYTAGSLDYVFRISAGSMHVAKDTSGWTAITGDLLTTREQITTAQFINKLYACSIYSEVLEIDPSANTSAKIVGAPKGKFIESFAERILVGNIPNYPTRIAWCGNLQPSHWDATTDISAGFDDLASAESDIGDQIAGLFNLGSVLVVLRERSIWHCTRQPFAEAPFRFTPIWSKSGCDLANTAVEVGGAIIFADYRTRGVWVYSPGAPPQRISTQIEDELYSDLQSLIWAEGAYDPFNQEYHLGLATDQANPDKLSKVWVWSRRHKAWSYDLGLWTTLSQASFLGSVTTINDLTGTINALTGTIDSLSGESLQTPAALRGTATGEVLYFDRTVVADYDGTAVAFEFQSPNIGSVQHRRTFQRMLVHLLIDVGGDLTVELSKDESNWVHGLTKTFVAGSQRQKFGHRNNGLAGDDLWWRLTTSNSQVRLFSWWAKMIEKGLTRNDGDF